MNRQQIALAQRLFDERGVLERLLERASAKGGISVAVNGTYQDEETVAVARGPVLDLINSRIKRINADLSQLGWDGK